MPETPEVKAARLLGRARFVLTNSKAMQAVKAGVKGPADVQAILNDISDPAVREQMRVALEEQTVKTDG